MSKALIETQKGQQGSKPPDSSLDTLVRDYAKGKCPTCATTLSAGDVQVCIHCKLPSHQDCYDFSQNCGTMGCKGARGYTSQVRQESGDSTTSMGEVSENLEASLAIIEEAQKRVETYMVKPSWSQIAKFRARQLPMLCIWKWWVLDLDIIVKNIVSEKEKSEMVRTGIYLAAMKKCFYPRVPSRSDGCHAPWDDTSNLTMARAYKIRGAAFEQPGPYYTAVAKDFLAVGRPKEALQIAQESEDPALVRKTLAGIHRYYLNCIHRIILREREGEGAEVACGIMNLFLEYEGMIPKPNDVSLALFCLQVNQFIRAAVKDPSRNCTFQSYYQYASMSTRYFFPIGRFTPPDGFEKASLNYYKKAQERLEVEGQYRQQLALAKAFDDNETWFRVLSSIQTTRETIDYMGDGEP